MSCPHCQESARFKEYRRKKVVSLLGEIDIWRGYYHCRHCSRGHFPWDGRLRLSSQGLTPGSEEVTTLGGLHESFGKAAERTLYKMAGLRLSESTVQRTTEATGERLGQKLHEGEVFGPNKPWDWHRDRTGATCAYLSVDATGIMMQGENAAKTEGRMAYVGMIYNPQPRQPEDEVLAKPCDGVRYLAGHYTLEELGQQMRCQAAQVGVQAAECWLALTDGGAGLEHWIDVYFPLAQKILDFRHASEYLNDFAKQYRSGDEAEALMSSWCHTMKHEGGAVILAQLQALDRRKMTKAARAEHDRVLRYIGNHVERMKYPEYLERGWHIATGAVESACKTVVNQRLCQGGMRWGVNGSDALCHLRALYRSDPDQWNAFWNYALAA